MCNKVVEEFPFLLEDVPDNLKDAGEGGGGNGGMCNLKNVGGGVEGACNKAVRRIVLETRKKKQDDCGSNR